MIANSICQQFSENINGLLILKHSFEYYARCYISNGFVDEWRDYGRIDLISDSMR